MTRRVRIVAMVAALVALIILMGATPVFAKGPCGPVGAPPIPCTKGDIGFAEGTFRLVDMNAAAEAIGIEPDDVSNQLWAGRTLVDMVDSAGVDLAFVRDAVDAERYRAIVDSDYKRDDRPDLCFGNPCEKKHCDSCGLVKTTAALGLRLRYGPGTGHRVYRVAPAGTVLKTTGNVAFVGSYKWVEVDDGGKNVWCAAKYLAPICHH